MKRAAPGAWILALFFLLPAFLTFPGCSSDDDDGDDDSATATPQQSPGDEDEDGFTVEDGDCNDADAAINPDAAEVCDEVDNNCDGLIDGDATDASYWYQDSDFDGYGVLDDTIRSCAPPSGYADNIDDCDDTNSAINPAATEVCDEAATDENCDGLADDEDSGVDASTQGTYYTDSDDDGFGDVGASATLVCHPTTGLVTDNTDCNDADAQINPDGTEICDPEDVDENCNGTADDADTTTTDDSKTPYYLDGDLDGYGDITAEAVLACEPMDGYVTDKSDCNDGDGNVNPAATEVCDAEDMDENCNGSADDADATTATTSESSFYTDADSDGFGSSSTAAQTACQAPVGTVADSSDCNDSDPAINPAATEVCDSAGTDENCNGSADDADPTTSADSRTTYYHDVDQDKYGTVTDSRLVCSDPSTSDDWWSSDGTDCDDRDLEIYPGADEYCNGIDDNCDGEVDESSALDATPWYLDDDRDGYGASSTTVACNKPVGYASQGGDCDDVDNTINPDSSEVCDPAQADENCNGTADDADETTDDATKATFYVDADGDGYGDENATGELYCIQPSGYASNQDDCNDSSADYHPGAEETCSDPADYNCDGSFGIVDLDRDGSAACDDCDDDDPEVYPGATEVCDPNNRDEDCNDLADDEDSGVSEASKSTWYPDTDDDGYGSSTDDGTLACDQPEGYVASSSDCDDGDGDIHPGATEVCDDGDVDENCNGLVDEADPNTSDNSKTAYHHDVDTDGFGIASGAELHCDDPSTSTDWWTTDNTDCNDRNGEVNPNADELCNGIDDDCDGDTDEGAINATTWYLDDDKDTYGQNSVKMEACTKPAGHTSKGEDCNDADGDINPGATEVCDEAGVDENCNGAANDLDDTTSISSMFAYYPDRDADEYGDSSDPGTMACAAPEGYVADNTDCDDSDMSYNPAVIEDSCSDPNDYNCDGSVGYDDADSDTFAACEDCDDEDASINPEAPEICDAGDVDENCNGSADDADGTLDTSTRSRFYPDNDSDAYGSSSSSGSVYCDAPEGYVSNPLDCDDANQAINPDAIEVCDDRNTDEDCDGLADNDDSSASGSSRTTYYHDVDTDGYGDADAAARYCDDPTTSTDWWGPDSTDCDDRNSNVNPGASEVCNGIDDDCDGEADESDAADATTYYVDVDGDGYGNEASRVDACKAPEGYVTTSGDCNDADEAMNPDALEVCDVNDTDENCNGLVEDDDPNTKQSTKTRYYSDADGDGYGKETDSGTLFCDPPAGYALYAGDCNDNNVAFNPGADESNCADPADYNCDGSVAYADLDGDTYAACEECDDREASINPGAPEICDGLDNDCDGLVDDGDDSVDLTSQPTWYPDADTDGYGDSSSGAAHCSDPSTADLSWTLADGDCNDADGTIHPAADETCNSVDDDCDGSVDEGASDAALYHTDADSDGYGDPFNATRDCALPDGMVTNGDDCDDTNDGINPGAMEDCTNLNVDLNCNDLIGCDDPSCSSTTACLEAEVCTNGEDDDGDGLVDCDDTDCNVHPDCAVPSCPDADLGSALGAGIVYGTTAGASNDLSGSCGGGSAEDISLSWTAPGDGYYLISTRDATFDTVLYVRDGDCDGEELACNDDGDSSTLQSEVPLYLSAGQVVAVVIDGYGTDTGDFVLNARATEAYECTDGSDNDGDGAADCLDDDCASDPSCLTETCDDGLDNDGDGTADCLDPDCSGDSACLTFTCADDDAGSELPLTYSGVVIPQSDDTSGSCGGNSGSDQAIRWTAPSDATYTFSTSGSEFDTVLYVMDQDCSSGVELACNDDASYDTGLLSSEVTLALSAGQTVIVIVDAFGSSDTGAFTLTIVATEVGACTDAIDNDGDGLYDCDDTDCASDTACALEDCTNGLDDDGDGLADCVDGDCASEPTCQELSCPDYDLASAVGAGVAMGTTVGASNDFASDFCGSGGEAADITFAWTAPAEGTYAIDTLGSDFDSILYFLYESCTGSEATCNDQYGGSDQSRVDFYAMAGESFIIVVDGWATFEGNYVLNISQSEADACEDGLDNDGDGLTDCEDEDCTLDLSCLVEDCENGADDDLDNLIDCADSDCSAVAACTGYSCPDLDIGGALGDGVASGTTLGAGNDMVGDCGGPIGEAAEDVTLQWTAPADGYYTFDTFGSAFDTVLYAHNLTCDGASLTCNDQADNTDQSAIALYLTSGDTVVLVVDGWSTDSGNYVLNIHADEAYACEDGIDNDTDGLTDCADDDCATDTACLTEVCDDSSDNDGDGLIDCADADCTADAACVGFSCPDFDLGATVGTAVLTGSTDDATNNFATSCGGGASPDVAASWTAPLTGYYTVDTFGSAFDTILALRDGDCNGSEVGCNDQANNTDQSAILFYAYEGATATFVIDGYQGDSGAFQLNLTFEGETLSEPTPTPPPQYDLSCVDDDLLDAVGQAVYTGSTATATNDYQDLCMGEAGGDVLLSWTAPANGAYDFDTAGSDYLTSLTLMYLAPEEICPGSMPYACDGQYSVDIPTTVSLTLGKGETLVIVVDGMDGASGNFVLNITQSETGFCDDGFDNDGDGTADCLDSDCANDFSCLVEDCTNGVDDDYDYAVDCRDEDCAGQGGCAAENCVDTDLGSATGTSLVTGTITGSGNDFEMMCEGEYGEDRVFSWTAPTSGNYLFSTEGSSFLTSLVLFYDYQGAYSCLGDLWTCNTQYDSGIPNTIEWWFTAGEQVNILIDDYNSMGGDYVLSIEQDTRVYVTFDVTVPSNTPSLDTVYITGDQAELGAWDPAGTPLYRSSSNLYTGTVAFQNGASFEYKFTRGTWETVEKDANGNDISNRTAIADVDKTLTLTVGSWADNPTASPNHLLINEVDYDQIGTDYDEFVEIYNPTADWIDVTDVALVLVNGGNGEEYKRVALSEWGSIGPGEYLVVASPTVVVDSGYVIYFTAASNNMQNGAPDGVTLIQVSTGDLIDSLSYEGSITAATIVVDNTTVTHNLVEGNAFTGTDVNDSVLSLIRSPNGADTDDAASDWALTTTTTPGWENVLTVP